MINPSPIKQNSPTPKSAKIPVQTMVNEIFFLSSPDKDAIFPIYPIFSWFEIPFDIYLLIKANSQRIKNP